MPFVLKPPRGADADIPTLDSGAIAFATDQRRVLLGDGAANHVLGVQINVRAVVAPGVGDDSADGYSPGSLWVDITNDKTYLCVDSTAGAAVWQQATGAGAGGITQLTGDGTAGPGSGSQALTLANSGVSAGTYGSATAVPVITVDAKGRATTVTTASLAAGVVPNLLHNGGFEVWQRGTSGTVADDTYYADRWYALSQTGTEDVQRATGTLGARYAALFKTNGASQRVALAQIVEASDAIPYRGRTVSFQFKAKASASTAIRFAILEWTGTADAVTSDVVGDWTSSTYTVGASTFFANNAQAVVQVGSGTATTSFGAFSVSGTVSASCNNLIVLVWTESSTTESVTITECGLYDTSTARDWLPRQFSEELALCQRHLYKRADGAIGIALNGDNMYSRGLERFPTTMRAAPTVSGDSFSVNAGSAGTPSFSTTADGYSVSNSANNWTATALVALNGATFSAEL